MLPTPIARRASRISSRISARTRTLSSLLSLHSPSSPMTRLLLARQLTPRTHRTASPPTTTTHTTPQAEASEHIPKDVLEAFHRFDRNGTGQLDYREVHAVLAHLGLDASYAHAREVLQRYDADSSRTIEARAAPCCAHTQCSHIVLT